MPESTGDWETLLEGVRRGDDAACLRFWNEYGPMVERVAQRHLSGGVQRRIDSESVMLSACRTFFRRAQLGEFDLPDTESLWRLLCAITANKVRMRVRYHRQEKRALDREIHPDALPEVVDRVPSPEDDLIFEEELELLLEQFEGEEREVLQGKLNQQTNAEIAAQMECSERTVRRMMKRIEARLDAMLDRRG